MGRRRSGRGKERDVGRRERPRISRSSERTRRHGKRSQRHKPRDTRGKAKPTRRKGPRARRADGNVSVSSTNTINTQDVKVAEMLNEVVEAVSLFVNQEAPCVVGFPSKIR